MSATAEPVVAAAGAAAAAAAAAGAAAAGAASGCCRVGAPSDSKAALRLAAMSPSNCVR